jgi:hypothetical protein
MHRRITLDSKPTRLSINTRQSTLNFTLHKSAVIEIIQLTPTIKVNALIWFDICMDFAAEVILPVSSLIASAS